MKIILNQETTLIGKLLREMRGRMTLQDVADQAGSIVVDIWKDVYANYPPTVADTITAAAKPTIVAGDDSQDLTLAGWTTTINPGDTLRFNIDSVTTISRVCLALELEPV